MNALDAITLQAGRHKVSGFSIAGIATYVQVPDLDVCFDMGECPLSAVPLSHVFLTHAHGDHSRCILRHHALRDMLGMQTAATYYLPDFLIAPFTDVIRAEARFEGVPQEHLVMPQLTGLKGDRALVPLAGKRDHFVSAFPVKHRIPSLGYTIVERRRKLKPELQALAGKEIAAMKQRGEVVTDDHDIPLVTFIGDCIGASLLDEAHIWRSPVVIIEATFLAAEDEARATDTGHTHVNDVVHALEELGSKIESTHIILKHFSMKHSKDEVRALVNAAVPDAWRSRVHLLL